MNGFSLKLKGKARSSCERNCFIYGSKTWPVKVKNGEKEGVLGKILGKILDKYLGIH